MGSRSNEVEFHLVQIVYFDVDEAVPTVSAFEDIWNLVATLRSYIPNRAKGFGGFWAMDQEPSKGTDISLSDSSMIGLSGADSKRVQGQVVFREPGDGFASVDCDLELLVMGAAPNFPSQIPAQLKFAVSNRVLERAEGRVTDVMQQIFLTCSTLHPFYGFIDLALSHDAHAGAAYTSIPNLSVSIQQKVEMNEWIFNGAPSRDQARSVYWGNYFGAKILDKLGGKDAFANRYHQATQFLDGSASGASKKYDDAFFLTLCEDPRSAAPSCGMRYDPVLDKNLLWLQRELANHNVLSKWPQYKW